MGYRSLDEIEYETFKSPLLILRIKWEDCEGKDIVTLIKKQYRSLSKELHPDKNVNDQNEEKNRKINKEIREINRAKEALDEFIIEPLEKGLGKRNNLVKELRKKLQKYSYEELQRYLDDKYRNKFFNKQQSINNNIKIYSQYFACLKLLGDTVTFFASIAFFIINGISCNVPIAVGLFASLLVPCISYCAMWTVYSKNEKEFNLLHCNSLLSDFDGECEDFSENDRTKLKWLKNSIILSSIICTSLMFCGVVLDLVANGFGATNSVLLFSLLLSLPSVFLVAAFESSVLNTACNYILKKTAINFVEEQFKGDDKSIEIENENNPKSFVATGCFSSRQLATTYPEISC